jgi:hypothetical protein
VRRSLPQGHWPRKRGAACGVIKTAQNLLSAAVPPSAASIAGRSGSHFGAERLEHPDRADHDLEFGHFARLVEFDEVDVPLEPAVGLFSARAVMEAPPVRTGLR